MVGPEVGVGSGAGGAAVGPDAGRLGAPPVAGSGSFVGSSPFGDSDFSPFGDSEADGASDAVGEADVDAPSAPLPFPSGPTNPWSGLLSRGRALGPARRRLNALRG
ncbi:hypothetical protein ABZ281_40760 [Streptomyces sp. NPDC006265]|uniref:hypothetical protein n=1 Tax=Streptomyces sp. NPDC006265 TaxID=3156740 RepID=UPI0033B171CC